MWKIFAKFGLPGLALGVLYMLYQGLDLGSLNVSQEWVAPLIFVFMLLVFLLVIITFYLFRSNENTSKDETTLDSEVQSLQKTDGVNLVKNQVLEAIIECKINIKLALIIEGALSVTREVRRATHIKVQESSELIKMDFLKCMKYLVNSNDSRVRGEAYYCLGEITLDSRRVIDEDFLTLGLEDKDVFVKACCANVLSNFVPLKNKTVEKLTNEISFIQINTELSSIELKYSYYISKTLRENKSCHEY